ncbi:type I restriction enzyme, R subunit [Methylorubrum extorquens]
MIGVGDRERATQKRVLARLKALGWRYLGDWTDRENRNLEQDLLKVFWARTGVAPTLQIRAYDRLREAASRSDLSPYHANKAFYGLLRYGVKVQPGPAENNVTVWPIDWDNPDSNEFTVAEEVTLKPDDAAAFVKRPDLVLYVNGIAVGMIELKRASVDVGQGIRQIFDSQGPRFVPRFFSTIQLVMAGNESQGLRYATTGTPQRNWLTWKEVGAENAQSLDDALGQLLTPVRLLELMHDFIVFDAGVKKTCRHNQFFGVKAAREHVRRREGGIIWHTQGSGKSLTMTWLAKWLRETYPDARVLVVTDREELDAQIAGVFAGVDEDIRRTRDGAQLIAWLNDTVPPLMCSLVHKFGRVSENDGRDVDAFAADLKRELPTDFLPKGNLFVFVDECHRTQSGKLNRAMRTILPDAMFIGFTGTPLLKAEKATSLETFGPIIHAYKFDEAVRDRVVLDLRYEARDIDQYLGDQAKIDEWFDTHTAALTETARAAVKKRWGTLKNVTSSHERLDRIVTDICMDFEIRQRLLDGRGNAILVTNSVHQACKLYQMFEATPLAGKVAIVSSYRPNVQDVKGEDAGEGQTEALEKYDIYRRMLNGQSAEDFEREVKERFIKEPGLMRLLIVVDKLLTGFDAPPATYLYIDKKMQDHGLFQAICRVNRLDGDDKDYGYIVDYRDLFNSLERAITDYTHGAFDGYDRDDVAGLITDRKDRAQRELEETRETLHAMVEPVELPKDLPAHFAWFAATGDPKKVGEAAPRRLAFYRQVARMIRQYADLAPELSNLGYDESAKRLLTDDVRRFADLSEALKVASGDSVDMTKFEPAMRKLIDTYVRARDVEVISDFGKRGLIDLIVERGADAVELLPEEIRKKPEAVAEVIENNVRRLIIDSSPANPRYYERMSDLLEALVRQRREQAISYAEYLAKVAEFIRQVEGGELSSYPVGIETGGQRALHDTLGDAEAAMVVHAAVKRHARDGWRDSLPKSNELKRALRPLVPSELFDEVHAVLRAQDEY